MIVNALAMLAMSLSLVQAPRVAQGVEYRIEATLDEATSVLTARAELRYTNNSGTPLDTLWVHEHLNAFRPNSAWARRDLQFDVRRFQDLNPQEHAFERLSRVEINGRSIAPVYPGAPDSTVTGIPLPSRLAPGATVVVRFDWTARPSTLPRRQGRRDRAYDWAQWYPRIAVYEATGWATQPLLPQGEFYGEFGTYDVTLDLAADQVVGSTGVPVEGDPGWAGAQRGTDPILYNREAYPATPARSLGLLSPTAADGRKRIRWRAERVHHFAWSANPAFVYEGGRISRGGTNAGDIGLHVLYLPADSAWANGIALRRTATALEWLQQTFGPYPWPQLTNLHRIEPGGTEFPMLLMDGSPSEGLIVHESAHQYVHGILANNEFREAWLDEGFASYLTNRYFETRGTPNIWDPSLRAARDVERRGLAEPVGRASADFSQPGVYSAMSYTKGELIFRMLEWLIGSERMGLVLRTFYQRYALQHVSEQDLRTTANEVARQDLGWFFDQWIHTTKTLDYGVRDAAAARQSDGSWTTRVTVVRSGEAWMPVELAVGDSTVRLESHDVSQVVSVRTRTRPAEAILDPGNYLLDLDPANNRATIATSP